LKGINQGYVNRLPRGKYIETVDKILRFLINPVINHGVNLLPELIVNCFNSFYSPIIRT